MVMRKNVVFCISLIFVIIGCAKRNKYDPDQFLDARKKDEVMSKLIRYQAKRPENVPDSLKHDLKYDAYYEDQKSRHYLIGYYINKDNDHFFLTTRVAPSNSEKHVATGGRMRFDNNGELKEYEEVFRTWKLQPDTLKIRALYLFDLMVKGESLEPYKTKTAGFHYIEFPDDKTFYDKTKRVWRTKE
jgi:hypothetical protein